jgi:hypothetical protein
MKSTTKLAGLLLVVATATAIVPAIQTTNSNYIERKAQAQPAKTETKKKTPPPAPIQVAAVPVPPPAPPVDPNGCEAQGMWWRADNFACIPKPTPVAVATTAPAPRAAPVAGFGSCDLANNYDWPVATARAVCMAESSGNPANVNMADNHGKCVGSFGLMQIGCFWFPYYGYDSSHHANGPVNMEIAYKIYKRSGNFSAWGAYNSGAYLKYL